MEECGQHQGPAEIVPSSSYMGRWVSLRANLDAVKKSLLPLPEIEPRLYTDNDQMNAGALEKTEWTSLTC
jgi:hypothetical protein